jgi:serine phosphatase RsbU (regulator of sigma subunit)
MINKVEGLINLFPIPTVELIDSGYALCDIPSLQFVYCNPAFIEWFDIQQEHTHLDLAISTLNKDILFKRIDKRGYHSLLIENDSANKKIPLLIDIKFQKTDWQGISYIAVHATDMSQLKEKDMLIASHSTIIEQSNRELSKKTKKLEEMNQKLVSLSNKYLQRTLELDGKNTALENAQNHINSELEIARNLQIEILPACFPSVSGCEGAAYMVPATTMGGDFYDFIELPDGKVGLVMADVSGKGVPAAFFMAVARTNLRLIAYDSSGPAECLRRTNELLCVQNPMYLFVTIFYGIFDPITGILTYANGGHNPPVIRRADGSVEMLASMGDTALGVIEDLYFQEQIEQFSPGDSLILYTDGVTEAFNTQWEEHGEKRMLDQVRLEGNGSAKHLVNAIFNSVIGFAGIAPQSDDITITVLKWNPSS